MENNGGQMTVKLNRSIVLDIIKRGKTTNDIVNIIDMLIKEEFVTLKQAT